VSERAGRWFVSLLVEEEIPDPEPAHGEPVGVDLGVEAMATCSEGRRFENPKALKKALRRLKRLYRELSRRKKGSKNWEKTRKTIARLHLRIANIRKDALFSRPQPLSLRKTSPIEKGQVWLS
jgi:putative transposase